MQQLGRDLYLSLAKVAIGLSLTEFSAAIDPLMRKEQTGIQKGRSLGDHIFTLRQVIEQCQEWNTSVYANLLISKRFLIEFTEPHSGVVSSITKSPQLYDHNQTALW